MSELFLLKKTQIGPGAYYLPDFISKVVMPITPKYKKEAERNLPEASIHKRILASVENIISQAPLRNMVTPRGGRMSVAMTNCGRLGWTSDKKGYRYTKYHPESMRTWPPLPELLKEVAKQAALSAGYKDFIADCCLINHYQPGALMGLHQDKDEDNWEAPIVSVSLGLPITFLFGGIKRQATIQRILLKHGDVLVWGGASRLNYHGVLKLKAGHDSLWGERRINLTFRKVGLMDKAQL